MLNIVLYQPKIPPNTGNIARLCVGADVHLHIIRPIGFFLDDKTMKRAGCDYWPHLKLTVHDALDHFLKSTGVAEIFFITKFGKKRYTDACFNDGDYLLFGSEDTGLPEDILKENSDLTLHIPMDGPVRSINLSNAVSIVLYEAIRQIRGQSPVLSETKIIGA